MVKVIKVILVFLFCCFSYGQQINTFITQTMKNNPGKAVDSLTGVTVVTHYEAAKNYFLLGKCHELLNQEEIGFNYFITSKKAFEALGKTDDAFLAAQGIKIDEAENIKNEAKIKNYSVQHAFELKRFHMSSRVKDNDTN